MEGQNTAEIAMVIQQALKQYQSQHRYLENPVPHATWTQNDIGSAIVRLQQDNSDLKVQIKQLQQL
jgi:hypothetical protein